MNLKTLAIKIAFAPFAASDKKKLERRQQILNYTHPPFHPEVHQQ